MDKLKSSGSVRQMLTERGLNFNKSLGQNFLIDNFVLESIINSAEPLSECNVIEIGPGAGVLTYELAKRAKKVVAVEIDSGLIPLLKDNLSEFSNVTLINEDVLKINLKELIEREFDGGEVKVIANLPYYITTPIIMKLLEEKPGIKSITIMIQKEVADRLSAKAGQKAYGAITLAVNYYSAVTHICTAPPSAFVPQPKVSSSVIRLDILKEPPVLVKSEKNMFKLIRAAFGQRRKTFANSVSSILNISKENIIHILESNNFNQNLRGEALNISEFANLSDQLFHNSE